MDFLAPLMLVGAIGAGLPLALHLFGRRRARRVRFAAMDFLLGSDRKVSRSIRLRERLLLIARVLACLALALALAKPYTSCADSGAVVTRGPQAAVIVVDDSFAAGFRIGDQLAIDRAKVEARRILAQLGPEAEVAVMTTSRGAASPTELSRDHIRLRDHISRLESTAQVGDITAALRRAERLLAASNHRSHVLYLLSTVPATGLGHEPPWPPGSGPTLVTIDPTDGAALDNAALTGVELSADPDAGPRGVRVVARAAFHGTGAVDREVALAIGGQVVARGTLHLTAGMVATTSFSAVLPPSARVADLVVSLTGDALPLDDRRFAVAAARTAVPVLLVDGDPRTVRHDDELFYLATALRPGDRGDSGVTLTQVTVDELASRELDGFDVVILANAHALSAAVADRLSAWVTAGGGLLVTVGDNVDPEAYRASMAALLPQSLATAIDTGFGQSAGERSGRALRLTKLEVDHPLFAAFGKDAAGLADARFRKVMLLGPTTEIGGRRVLARFDNGAVALVEAESGAGRILLYTSTVDRDWTDLPLQPGFLPLFQQAVRYLAGKPPTERKRDVPVGDHVMIDVGPDTHRLEVVRPSGERTVFEGDLLAERKQVRFSDTTAPGIYRIVDVGKQDKRSERDEASFAVNLDPGGSDLTRAAPSTLPASGAEGAVGEQRHERRIELWHAVAAALLLFLLLESILLLRA